MKRVVFYFIVFLFLAFAGNASASFNIPAIPELNSVIGEIHQLNLVYLQSGNIQISNPETSKAFYDELKGKPRDYFINSSQGFDLYLNIMVPEETNRDGRYSVNVFDEKENLIFSTDTLSSGWQEYYDSFSRDYYLKGPEFDKNLDSGKYKVEVSSKDNLGKYVLIGGKKQSYEIKSLLNVYWQMPLLKVTFLKTSVLQFFLTLFGIAGIGAVGVFLIIIAILYFIFGSIGEYLKHRKAKTLLLTSNGMQMKEEIIKLLQKPAYDITVAFISTAAKPEENLDYLKKDWNVMRDELGFNVEEIDIEGKKEHEVMRLLELKDIIFVEGGNTFYLLKAMRGCNFEKIIKKLLKKGKVYIGASAGSIVAGKTIKTSDWKNPTKNFVKVRSLKGLNLVPFDVFCHYNLNPEEFTKIIKQHLPFKWQRRKLRILTDDQAILVQGKEVDLIGKGDKIII